MTILTRFFILAFSFLFLTSSSIVSAFGDYYDWDSFRDYPPTLHIPVSVSVPEPVEINPHRKISITAPMSGVISVLQKTPGDLDLTEVNRKN